MVEDCINGLLVPEKNEHELAIAIEKLLSNLELQKKMGEAGLNKVEQWFDIKKNANEIFQLFKLIA